MSENLQMSVQARPAVGGSAPRRLRREGLVPGVVYGGGEDSLAVSVPREVVETAGLHDSQLLDLAIEGAAPTLVIVKDIQIHYLTHDIIHVDFQRISRDEKLVAPVSVVEAGEPVGVTRDGGILAHLLREIELRCLPSDLPEEIVVDVSALEIGDSIHAGELELPAEVELVTDPEQAIFTVTTSRAALAEEEEEEAAEEGEAEEAGEEGAEEAEDKE